MNQFRRWTLDRHKYMSEPEVKKLKRTITDKALADLQTGRTTWPRWSVALQLGLFAGLRVSEIAGVRIGGLFLNYKESRVRVTGKGGHTRDVFISRSLMQELVAFLKWKRTMGEPTDPEDFVLISSHGQKFSTRGLQYAFKVAIREAGLPSYYSIHACRHSYGTALYRRTKDLRLVQKQLGHASITTTTVYSDVTPDDTIKAANGLFEDDDEEKE